MPGNKSLYQDSLHKAHNYAWDRKWPQAIAEYRRALVEFDSDPTIWVSLGVALLEAKRVAEAKDAYQRASDLRPADVALQQKLAEICERLGDGETALQFYFQVATALQKGDAPAKAVDVWRAILRLQPAHIDSHQYLAELLEQLQRPGEASQEFAVLARLLYERSRTSEASERARHALALDAHNADARQFIESLQLAAPEAGRAAPPSAPPTVSASEDASPMQRAARLAMARLADSLFEPGQAKELIAFISQAVDFQARDITAEAIESYQRALAHGATQPEIHFNLGVLYLNTLRLEEATQAFTQTVALPAYAVGSHFGLGQCYRKRGSMQDALEHALAAIRLIDVTTVKPTRSESMSQSYDILRARYRGQPDDELAAFADALLTFLRDKQWRDKLNDFRRRLDVLADDAEPLPLAELLNTQAPEQVLSALSASQDFLTRQKYTAAAEECYHALALAPAYLPLHARLAEVFVNQGHTEAAISKYQMMGMLQHMRGETAQATETYRHILELAPLDVDVRAKLIGFLSERGAIAEVIEQHMALGEVYHHLAQLESALKEYEAALNLIPRAETDRWSDTLLHLMGEIYVQRADWKEALAIYLQLRQLAPDDSKASLRLIDLYAKLGRELEMESELEHLIAIHQQADDVETLIPVIRDLIALRPRNLTLKNRLIDLLIQGGESETAVAELDSLGEAHLMAGRMAEAMQIIERIIVLQPRNVQHYRALLAQLQEGL